MTAAHTYLDYNATAPIRPEASEAVCAALGATGNPSSVHAMGRAARALVDSAREEVAALVGARPERVTFTSCGSEANALALAPRNPGTLLVSAVEHPSVLAGGRFATSDIETIPVDTDGVVDIEWLAERFARGPKVSVISVMAANNETGVIQPVAQVAELAREAGAVFHCDGVQAAGRLPLDIEEIGVDLVSLSAHKMGGPRGVGAFVRRSADVGLVTPLIRGGGQERSLRAGTENVAGIAGFGAAARMAQADLARSGEMARLRDWLEIELRSMSPDTIIFGAGVDRLANTSCFALPDTSAEKAVIALDLDRVAVSSGAACSSGKVGPSHVLAAMGVDPHLAGGAIRVSLGWASMEEDVERFLMAWRRITGVLGRKRRDEAA